jgi:DNA repair exonuclease SbcCD ATPase subunit
VNDASMVRAREDMECHCVTRWSGTERETDNSGCALHNDEVLRILTRDEEIVQLRQALRTLEAENERLLEGRKIAEWNWEVELHRADALAERVRELEATIANAVATLLVNTDGYSCLARMHLEAALTPSGAPREWLEKEIERLRAELMKLEAIDKRLDLKNIALQDEIRAKGEVNARLNKRVQTLEQMVRHVIGQMSGHSSQVLRALEKDLKKVLDKTGGNVV